MSRCTTIVSSHPCILDYVYRPVKEILIYHISKPNMLQEKYSFFSDSGDDTYNKHDLGKECSSVHESKQYDFSGTFTYTFLYNLFKNVLSN